MERSGRLNSSEVVGVATAMAAAIGGILVALGRAQQHGMRERVATVEHHVRESIGSPTHAVRKRAVGLSDQLPPMRATASDAINRAGEFVKPTVENVSDLAVSRAENVRAASIDAVERLRETVLPAAAGVFGTLAEQASHVRERGEETSVGIVESSAHAAEVAITKTKSATRDILATIVWMVIAATITYVALLDEERRSRLRSALSESVEQLQLLRTDFAGYNDEI